MRRSRCCLAFACLTAILTAPSCKEGREEPRPRLDPMIQRALDGIGEMPDPDRRMKEEAIRVGLTVGLIGFVLALGIGLIAHYATNSKQAIQPPPPPASKGVASLIGELMSLRDKGALTEEEFQRKKAEILKRM